MRWREVEDLFEYWRRSPPVHEMVAGWLGIRPEPEPANWEERRGIGMTLDELQAAVASGPSVRVGV